MRHKILDRDHERWKKSPPTRNDARFKTKDLEQMRRVL